MNSLRLRLIVLLLTGLISAWVLTSWTTYIESRHEMDELFDAQLAQSAQVLFEFTKHELNEHSDDNEKQAPTMHEYEQKLTFQIWDHSRLVMRSASAPTKMMGNKVNGFTTSVLFGQSWRIFTRWDLNQQFMISVAEPIAQRESLARHITLKMLLPSFLTLPILAIMIWLAVGSGLKPLEKIRHEVKLRNANQLEMLHLENVPNEVLPLVESLNELFDRVKIAFESERQFTANAAHELRTPLSALKIQAQVALKSSEDTERQTALNNLIYGVNRATHLVEQLLTLARVDPENAAKSFESVNLNTLSQEVINEIEHFSHSKNITLQLQSIDQIDVFGNHDQLGVLLRNLLDNAIRYSPRDGLVIIKIYKNLDSNFLEVIDTGPGISSAEIKNVHKRFYRVLGNKEEGSGLGLSIVGRIAQLHQIKFELIENEFPSGLISRLVWQKNTQV